MDTRNITNQTVELKGDVPPYVEFSLTCIGEVVTHFELRNVTGTL